MSQCKRQARIVVSVLNNQVSSESKRKHKDGFHKCVYILKEGKLVLNVMRVSHS